MKKFKKIALTLLVYTMVMLMLTGTALQVLAQQRQNADDESSVGYIVEDLAYLTPERQLLELQATTSISKAAREKAMGKINFMLLSEDERTEIVQEATQIRGLYATKICNVPYFEQQNSYYCGPATAKQTIHYLSGGSISPTQAAIAKVIGTTSSEGSSTTNITNWLKTKGYYYYSVSLNNLTLRDIVNYLATGIDYYNYPGMNGIKITSAMKKDDGCWYYTTNGHILNASGIKQYEPDYQNSKIQLTDPYITIVKPSMTSGKYYVPVDKYKNSLKTFWW